MRNRGYYLNGLRSWREELRREQRLGIARLRRLENMKHPDAGDQALYLQLRAKVIGMINEAETDALQEHEVA